VAEEFKYQRNVSMINQVTMPRIPSEAYPLKVGIDSPSKFVLKVTEPHIAEPSMKVCLERSLNIGHPHSLPTFIDHRMFERISVSTIVEVTPEITQTDESLRQLSPKERECFFEDEMKLRFFKVYTQRNCELECAVDNAVKFCRICMPTIYVYKNKTLDLCHGKINVCGTGVLDTYTAGRNCTCLPTCNSLIYHVKYYSSDSSDDNETVITVRMNMDDLILYRRFQQFTFSDAVSYVGGLLGLFAGVSMLSIVELCYYFTLRVASDVVRHLRLAGRGE
jgi:amiloride-sensitive sodium channel